MSVCLFLSADVPLPITEDTYDHLALMPMDGFYQQPRDFGGLEYGGVLEWDKPTEQHVERLKAYISSVLEHTDMVQIWYVWLSDGQDRFRRKSYTTTADALSLTNMQDLMSAEIGGNSPQNVDTYYHIDVTR